MCGKVDPPISGQTEAPSARLLQTHAPAGLKAVAAGEWEEIELAVDSGASETVVNENMVLSAEVVEGPMSRQGVEYEIANGVRIPNLGEKTFRAISREQVVRNITAQVCDVNKGLLSVSKVVGAGSRVVFDPDGSYIEGRQTGACMNLTERNGMYMLKLWTKKGF